MMYKELNFQKGQFDLQVIEREEEVLFELETIYDCLGCSEEDIDKKSIIVIDRNSVYNSHWHTSVREFITSLDLFKLMVKTNKPVMLKFLCWICNEILPEIYKEDKKEKEEKKEPDELNKRDVSSGEQCPITHIKDELIAAISIAKLFNLGDDAALSYAKQMIEKYYFFSLPETKKDKEGCKDCKCKVNDKPKIDNLLGACEAAQNTEDVEYVMLSVPELVLKLDGPLSASETNKLLEDKGLQFMNVMTWFPTKIGKTMCTNHYGCSIKWNLKEVKEYLSRFKG